MLNSVLQCARAAAKPLARAMASSAGGPPLESVLIANRGEIACRVASTAQRLGMRVVAVYSDADAGSKHVRIADESICLGPAPSTESYLRMDKVMGAVKKTGAKAVHPGYGFLSENATFVEELEREGIVFVGPPASAITDMGDKIQSKRIAKDAGVNIIPGYEGEIESADVAVERAADIGYPLMIKASAGGGGKGMRIAWNDAELRDAFRDCTAEAASSFGDTRLLMERYIATSRHIEIQVLADSHGNAVWLPERECSIQRRNQKVLEEAPSPFIDPETRRKMGEQAVALCKAVGYRSAGTVEFLVDDEKNFYFLEMNTRLQVEHPVTEAVTKLDLVEEMLEIAAGKPLRISQERAQQIHGWALESRVYAEDPARGFLPCTGLLKDYREPSTDTGSEHYTIRCDSGIEEGSEISIYYDPMICKLISHAPTRSEALDVMTDALDKYVIRGLRHNLAFLRDMVNHSAFRSGDIDTSFIPKHFPDGWKGASLTACDSQKAAGLSAMIFFCQQYLAREAIGAAPAEPVELVVTLAPELVGNEATAETFEVVIEPEFADDMIHAQVSVGRGDPSVMSISMPFSDCMSPVLATAEVDGVDEYMGILGKSLQGFNFQYKGAELKALVQTPQQAELNHHMPIPVVVDASKVIATPMPAALVSILVKEGDSVSPGDEIAIVEAMKMRNVLKSETSAVVKSVLAKEGDVLPMDGVIVELE